MFSTGHTANVVLMETATCGGYPLAVKSCFTADISPVLTGCVFLPIKMVPPGAMY